MHWEPMLDDEVEFSGGGPCAEIYISSSHKCCYVECWRFVCYKEVLTEFVWKLLKLSYLYAYCITRASMSIHIAQRR